MRDVEVNTEDLNGWRQGDHLGDADLRLFGA